MSGMLMRSCKTLARDSSYTFLTSGSASSMILHKQGPHTGKATNVAIACEDYHPGLHGREPLWSNCGSRSASRCGLHHVKPWWTRTCKRKHLKTDGCIHVRNLLGSLNWPKCLDTRLADADQVHVKVWVDDNHARDQAPHQQRSRRSTLHNNMHKKVAHLPNTSAALQLPIDKTAAIKGLFVRAETAD
eukprot:2365200-Amphidinium_carterae.2